MKKFILLLVGMGLFQSLQAQNWEVQIQRLGENHHIKNLKLKPNRPLRIGRLLTDEDSLREFKYFEGHFLGGTDNSLQIKLSEVKTHQVFTNGISHQSTIPGKLHFKNKPYEKADLFNDHSPGNDILPGCNSSIH